MFVTFLGILIMIIVLLFLVIDRYFPYVEFMKNFTNKGFKRTICTMTVIGVFLIAFGIYNHITYQPPYIDIEFENERYLIVGKIGTIGYILSEKEIFQENKEAALQLVSWEKLDENVISIYFEDDSGNEFEWRNHIVELDNEFSNVIEKQVESVTLYELSPIVFQKSGKWKVTIKEEGKKLASWKMNVY